VRNHQVVRVNLFTTDYQAAERVDDTQGFRGNPTNAVGGSFILSLQGTLGRGDRIPPTQLVILHIRPGSDHPESESEPRVRLGMNEPPTALVGLSEHFPE
jgi:hypothetical protein